MRCWPISITRARPWKNSGCSCGLCAPYRPFASPSTISCVVSLALRRAGIEDPPSRGANLLRHSAATAMLRGGATLQSVGAVLRHRSLGHDRALRKGRSVDASADRPALAGRRIMLSDDLARHVALHEVTRLQVPHSAAFAAQLRGLRRAAGRSVRQHRAGARLGGGSPIAGTAPQSPAERPPLRDCDACRGSR